MRKSITTLALCSSLLLAVSCSSKRNGLQANNSTKIKVAGDENPQSNPIVPCSVDTPKHCSSDVKSQIESLNASNTIIKDSLIGNKEATEEIKTEIDRLEETINVPNPALSGVSEVDVIKNIENLRVRSLKVQQQIKIDVLTIEINDLKLKKIVSKANGNDTSSLEGQIAALNDKIKSIGVSPEEIDMTIGQTFDFVFSHKTS